jgi:hypothetical protein
MTVMQVTARAKETAAALPDTPSSPADIIASAKIPAASPTGSHGVQTATLLDVDGHAAGEVIVRPARPEMLRMQLAGHDIASDRFFTRCCCLTLNEGTQWYECFCASVVL